MRLLRLQLRPAAADARRRPYARRGGYSLLLFAMLLFAFLAIGALSIDVGNATLARVSMKNCTDACALEGLRHRDAWLQEGSIGDITAIDVSEEDRRMSTHRLATAAFDDDADLATLNSEIALGAGSLLSVERFVNFPLVSAVVVDRNLVYEPRDDPLNERIGLQLNRMNDVHGDMLAGDFNTDPDVPHDERSSYCGGTNAYCRMDFAPAPPGASHRASSFLVRMRRSADLHGLDNVPEVSSSGPAMPFILAWGSTLERARLVRGMDMHATSIATARPAMRVSRVHHLDGSAMLTPFIMRRTRWVDSFPVGAAVLVDITGLNIDGDHPLDIHFIRLCTDADQDGSCDAVGDVVGIAVDTENPCKPWNRIGKLLRLGCIDVNGDGDCDDPPDNEVYCLPSFDPLTSDPADYVDNDLLCFDPADYSFPMRAFVPIVEFDEGDPVLEPLVGRVIGFGQVTVNALGSGLYTITKRPGTVDPRHATVAGVGGFGLPAIEPGCPAPLVDDLPADTLDLLFRANQGGDVDGDGLDDVVVPNAVLAPVLVR